MPNVKQLCPVCKKQIDSRAFKIHVASHGGAATAVSGPADYRQGYRDGFQDGMATAQVKSPPAGGKRQF